MAITLTEQEADEIFEAAWQSGEAQFQDNGTTGFYELPPAIGHGKISWTSMHQGQLEVCIDDETYHHPIATNHRHEGWNALVSKFFLQGYQRTQTPNVKDVCNDYVEVAGQSYLFCLPDVEEIEHSPAQRCQTIRLNFELDLLRQFTSNFQSIAQPLKAILDGNTTTQFHQQLGHTMPAMQTALHQILHCPFTGAIGQLYLESKAIELLALQLAQWQESGVFVNEKWRSSDLEKLHHARSIITDRFDNPPSLIGLARQVGLSDRKLKQGFREVFGHTVFGYLHHHRLEQAHKLLRDDRLSIAEVSYAIGFSNRSYFAAAFHKKFGMNPSEFRRSKSSR